MKGDEGAKIELPGLRSYDRIATSRGGPNQPRNQKIERRRSVERFYRQSSFGSLAGAQIKVSGAPSMKLLGYLGCVIAVYAIIFIAAFIVLMIKESWKDIKKQKGGKG